MRLGFTLSGRGTRPSLALPIGGAGAPPPQPKRWSDAATWRDTDKWSDVA